MEETQTMEWLAERVLAERREQEKRQQSAHHFADANKMVHYFVNPNHPAIRRFYEDFKNQYGIPHSVPMSDRERTIWELQMLCPEVVQRMAEYYRHREEAARRVRGQQEDANV